MQNFTVSPLSALPQVRVLGAQQPYDFAAWPADAVILNLGTNDWNAFHNPPWGTRRQAAALSKP